MSWLEEVFKVKKPVIAMCHFQALPGDPRYDQEKGLAWVIEKARSDIVALQRGGVDGIMFSNEFSLPYLTKVEPITYTVMARIIGELKGELKVPYGVNVLWDPIASIDLAVAVDALFVREIFTGVYASDFGLWNTNFGEVVRHQYRMGAQKIKLLFNIRPEAAVYLGSRSITDIATSTVFNCLPDALCVSGLTAGAATDTSLLQQVKTAVPETPVFVNTGVRLANVEEQLSIADGAVTGTTFKKDGVFFNPVDESRVKTFMDKVKAFRSR
ncbi:sgc region protein SgcQ [Spirochaetia bacterium]|nr:sgc region protein SgcQ [Spirochaetia bacterium]